MVSVEHGPVQGRAAEAIRLVYHVLESAGFHIDALFWIVQQELEYL